MESVQSVLHPRHFVRLALSAVPVFIAVSNSIAVAQGVATSGIRGAVSDESGAGIDGARVRVTQSATGFAVEVEARQGRFLIQGLEPGGAYVVVARRLGFGARQQDSVVLRLGELLELNFVLQRAVTELEATTIVASSKSESASAHASGGTATTIGESLLHGLPTLNRDLYDFVRLVPQISTRIGATNAGFSAGGVGFRFNNFLINGVSERTMSGSASVAYLGSKSIPLDAVQEYQVLLAPYDVRYGDFAGALINAVTKSGTNTPHGSVFAFGRNDALARKVASSGASAYDRVQYGFSFGGPIVRNRLHFFIAPELQRFTYPAPGPYVGQPPNADRAVPVSGADLARLTSIMRNFGLTAGSAGPVQNGNPMRNVFSRVDLFLPALSSRLVAWNNYSNSDDIGFSRAALDTFSLSTNQVTRASKSELSALEIHTALPRAGGGHNELVLSHRSMSMVPLAGVQQPLVRVSVPRTSAGRITINSGTHETAQDTWVHSLDIGLKDNVTLPLGSSHVFTMGTEVERFRIHRAGVPGSYGTWSFVNLDSLELGIADRYEVGLDFGGGRTPLGGLQYATYLGDQWEANSRLSITAGLRADLLAVGGNAPYHSGVDSIFGRRTDEMPRHRIEISPRAGFIWDVSSTGAHRIRGGAGIFTGRYPLGWAHTALMSYGAGVGLLRCGHAASDLGMPPPFSADHDSPPLACANGSAIAANRRADVDLLDPNLRMMRTLRGSLAYDGSLRGGFRFTGEALFTRALSDFLFVNLNLRDPATSDRNGRVMYGSIGALGISTPGTRSNFSEVIDLRNTSGSRSYQLSARLENEVSERSTVTLYYTYSRVRDAVTPLSANMRGTSAWASERVLSGRQDDLSLGISSNDVPHRVVVAGIYAMPRVRWTTRLSFYYVGESGRPFTYVAFGTLRRGDLNADGANTNDPIYIPRDAFDDAEILFAGTSDSAGADNSPAAQATRVTRQRTALEQLLQGSSCLKRQRGHIMTRNSCREPWSNTTIASVRQSVPIGRRTVEAQLDLFNVLNLLSSRWGARRQVSPLLLEHVAQTAEPIQTSHSIFRFDPSAPRWTTVEAESAFQLQLALRYSF